MDIAATDEERFAIEGMLRTGRIMVAALAMGVLMFLVMAAFVLRSGRPPVAEPWGLGRFFTPFAIGFAALAVGLRLVLPRFVVGMSRKTLGSGKSPLPKSSRTGGRGLTLPEGDLGLVLGLWMLKTFTGAGILEGAAFFAVIAYVFEGTMISLVVGLILVVLLLASFPTRSGIEGFLQEQMERLQADRQAS